MCFSSTFSYILIIRCPPIALVWAALGNQNYVKVRSIELPKAWKSNKICCFACHIHLLVIVEKPHSAQGCISEEEITFQQVVVAHLSFPASILAEYPYISMFVRSSRLSLSVGTFLLLPLQFPLLHLFLFCLIFGFHDFISPTNQVTHVRGTISSRSDCVWKCREHSGDGLALTRCVIHDQDSPVKTKTENSLLA